MAIAMLSAIYGHLTQDRLWKKLLIFAAAIVFPIAAIVPATPVHLKVNWLAGSVTERLQMVATGKADLECANTTQTQTRLANVDFSNLIFVDGGGFLIKGIPTSDSYNPS